MSENIETSVSEQVEVSPVEQEALAQGWVPKDQFDGEPARWVDAGEFVRRGELFKKIDSQGKELKTVNKTLEALKSHYTKVEETAFNRALAALKQEKVLAQTEGEFAKAAHLEEEIERVQQEKQALKETFEQEQEEPSIHPDVAQWIDKNTWYKSNITMRAAADALGRELASQGVKGPALLKAIDVEIRKEFPHKFQNPKRQEASSVEGDSVKGSSSKKGNIPLTELEEQTMKTLVRGGHITKEKYLEDLRKIKGL